MRAITILPSVAVFLLATGMTSLCHAETHGLRLANEHVHSVRPQGTGADVDPHPKRTIDLDGALIDNDEAPAPTDGRSHLWNNTLVPPPDPGPDVVQDPIRFHIAMMEWLAYRIAVRQTQR